MVIHTNGLPLDRVRTKEVALNLDPLHRPSWRGRTNVDQITIAAVEYAESLRRTKGAQFVVTQGSYQGGSGDPLSAGTHDLGGVIDLRWTGDDHDIWCLRKAGFAAWHRDPSQGPWPDHVHAVLIDHPRLAASAARQVESYRAGRNGLASNGPDDGPRINPIPVFDWPPEEDDMPLSADDKDFIRNAIRTEAKAAVDALLDEEQANGKSLRENIRAGGNAKDFAKAVADELGLTVSKAQRKP